MKMRVLKLATIFLAVLTLFLFGAFPAWAKGPGGWGGDGGKPGGETAGNNLSYPVIWAEGVTKILPGAPGVAPVLNGEWWYQWGTYGEDPDVMPLSCYPLLDEDGNPVIITENPLCFDGSVAGALPAEEPYTDMTLVRAYIQKDGGNVWQDRSADWSSAPVDVHWIDWGDNLESVDWYTRSQVRTEVVLFQDLFVEGNPTDDRVGSDPWLEYEMRHTSGWGIDEVHGLAATLDELPAAMTGSGTRATVYSHCARLTIQKLLVDRNDPSLANLVWVPEEGWTGNLINPPIFNGYVHEGGDGPGYYSAEINVTGRIIYGYTWNVRKLNDVT